MRRACSIPALLAILSLVVGLAGCVPAAPPPQTIKIGLITQLTGDMAATGQTVRNGAEMAVQEINDAGGAEVSMKKYPVELVVADSGGQEAQAIAAAQKLITEDNVLAIVEHEKSQVAVPVSWIAENGRTVLIGGIASPDFTVDPVTKQPKKYVFRNTFSGDFQGQALASFALTRLGAKKAAVLYDSKSEYNRVLAESFKATFVEGVGPDETALFTGVDGNPLYIGVSEGLGQGAIQLMSGEIVAFESYKEGDKDFTAQLNRIKAAAPDVIFMPNYLFDVPTQAKQARELGITAPFLGTDTWAQDDMLKACGSSCEGAYMTTDFRPEIPNQVAEKFIAAYKAKYGAEPEWPAASAYDAVNVLMLAFERAAKVTREGVRDGMTRVYGFQGVAGPLEYEAGTGDAVKGANILQIKDGKFVYVGNVNP